MQSCEFFVFIALCNLYLILFTVQQNKVIDNELHLSGFFLLPQFCDIKNLQFF
jgi:hypothetical protein